MLRNLLMVALVVSTLVGCGKDRKEEADKANAEIAAANAQLRSAEADHRKIETDLDRMESGFEARSPRNLENLIVGYERVKAKYISARDNTQSALDRVKESGLHMSDSEKRIAKNNISEINARLQKINQRISYLKSELERIKTQDIIPSIKPAASTDA